MDSNHQLPNLNLTTEENEQLSRNHHEEVSRNLEQQRLTFLFKDNLPIMPPSVWSMDAYYPLPNLNRSMKENQQLFCNQYEELLRNILQPALTTQDRDDTPGENEHGDLLVNVDNLLHSMGVEAEALQARVREVTHWMNERFWVNLKKSLQLDHHYLSDMHNNNVAISYIEVPSGIYLVVVSTLLLGVSQETLKDFFDDEKNEYQWNFHTGTPSLKVLTNFYPKTDSINRVSILQPSVPSGSTLFLQYSLKDPWGSVIVYSPIEVNFLRALNRRETPPFMPAISPVGFIISSGFRNSGDEASASSSTRRPDDSILTVVVQNYIGPVEDMEAIIAAGATLRNIVTSKMQDIKTALNCRYEWSA